jgi:signal peptidase I
MRTRSESSLPAIGLATLCAIILLFNCLDARRVDGLSMEPTLSPGQLVYINRVAYGLRLPFLDGYLVTWAVPKPGEMVVFLNPHEGRQVVKRCIAVAGDPIEIQDGTLVLARIELPLTAAQERHFSAYTSVPPGMIFVAGDNLPNSIDSRDYGFIRVENVTGKVILFSVKKDTIRVGFETGHDGA